MGNLEQAFAAHWKRKGFSMGGAPVLLALSGGIDSMVLAHLLLHTRIPFAAAHANFKLRAADADEDAAFVRAWCNAHQVVCHEADFATKAIAEEEQQSIQVTARNLRYEWFETLRKEHHYAAILTAHHQDDIAETLLINLSRGTGIAGLHGIPERNGAIIRPLLFANRAEISAYANDRAIAWREDGSNASDKYLRNAIRHHILPRLEELLPGAARRMAATAERVLGAELIYRQALAKRLAKLLERRAKDWYIPLRLLIKQEAKGAIAYELFTPFGFSAEQITQILELEHSESGKQVIGANYRVIRNRDFLVITALEAKGADMILIDQVPSVVETTDGRFHFSWSDHTEGIPDDKNTALISADDLSLPLILRTRKEGDYFYPLGMGMKKKKLKRFLVDAKVPLHEKDRVRILEHQQRILWVSGMRIDERFKISPATRKALQVVFEPNRS